ncbi:hypothetical protein, partial [Acinetobacter lactucae]|uniref:hypothetical protein n=1 Tax=Acinetobacter lactucae TaxID=1785128 RepID=UPI00157FEF30
GIGCDINTFLTHFYTIASHHIRMRRAKNFAFIFYDFTDKEFKRVLKREGIFARLDRLSGNDMTIFYIHTGSSMETMHKFNQKFMQLFGLQKDSPLPCIVFCRTDDTGFRDISIADLSSFDSMTYFHELYDSVEKYIQDGSEAVNNQYTWFKRVNKFVALEVVKAFITKIIESFFK